MVTLMYCNRLEAINKMQICENCGRAFCLRVEILEQNTLPQGLPDCDRLVDRATYRTTNCGWRTTGNWTPPFVQHLGVHHPLSVAGPDPDFVFLLKNFKGLINQLDQFIAFQTKEPFTPQKPAKIGIMHERLSAALTSLQRTFFELEMFDPAPSNSNSVFVAYLYVPSATSASISHGHRHLYRVDRNEQATARFYLIVYATTLVTHLSLCSLSTRQENLSIMFLSLTIVLTKRVFWYSIRHR